MADTCRPGDRTTYGIDQFETTSKNNVPFYVGRFFLPTYYVLLCSYCIVSDCLRVSLSTFKSTWYACLTLKIKVLKKY